MKNIVKISLILTVLALGANATPSKVTQDDREKYTVLENGVQRTFYPSSTEQELIKKEGVIVSFSDESKLSLNEFESKYGLKLQTKMRIGYYIFENISSKTDVQIVKDIIQNETNVKTVKPNWKMQNTSR